MSKKERLFPLNAFGGRMQDLRKNRLNISRPEFYDLIFPNGNVATESKSRTVKNWESGDCEPDLKTIKKICIVLKCSSDYLLGLDNCTTKDTQFIHEYTGLSEVTIDKLNGRIPFKWVSSILDKLISMNTFEYVLFHISEYINCLTSKKELEHDFHEELERIYSNEDGNYNGESEIEKNYHKLEKQIEHHEFNVNKWFMRTMSLIEENIEKALDTKM